MLKDGSEPLDIRLDRIFQLDLRSLNYPISDKLELTRDFKTYSPRGYTWSIDQSLDQGPDGACVGFAFAHDLIARPQVVTHVAMLPVDNDFAKKKIYWRAQELDHWVGGSYPGATPFYEGTSVLAGAKVIQEFGLYNSYYWALNLQQFAIGVGYDGPCVAGINWYESMFQPDTNGFISPHGHVVGGHAILIYGIKIVYKNWISWAFSRKWENVDIDKSYFKVKNSWGENWGDKGTCRMTLRDMNRLLNEQGDACFPNRVYIRK